MKDTITHLRELLSKATPGSWVFAATLQPPGHGFIDAHKDRHAQSVMENDRDVDEVAMKLEDGLLIVAAVNALPALLDRLAKLERFMGLLSRPDTSIHWAGVLTEEELLFCATMHAGALGANEDP